MGGLFASVGRGYHRTAGLDGRDGRAGTDPDRAWLGLVVPLGGPGHPGRRRGTAVEPVTAAAVGLSSVAVGGLAEPSPGGNARTRPGDGPDRASGQLHRQAGHRDIDPAVERAAGRADRGDRVGTRLEVCQDEAVDGRPGGLPADLQRAVEVGRGVVRDALRVGRLGEQQIAGLGQLHELVARSRIARVRERDAAGSQAQPDVGQEVRQQARRDVERADPERVTRTELPEIQSRVEHAWPVEREHGAQGARQGVRRQRRRRVVAQHAGAQQRVQVGDMVGMPVADDHRVDRLGGHELQQSRQGGVARIDQQPEPAASTRYPLQAPPRAATLRHHPGWSASRPDDSARAPVRRRGQRACIPRLPGSVGSEQRRHVAASQPGSQLRAENEP